MLTAFLYYLARKAWIPLAITVVIMGIFCPLSAVLIGLFLGLRWLWFVVNAIRSDRVITPKQMGLRATVMTYLFPKSLRPELGILGLAIVTLLPYVFSQSEFSPIVTAAQARLMPEFLPGGRLPFFPASLGIGLMAPIAVFRLRQIHP